jgi:hypothetical protein
LPVALFSQKKKFQSMTGEFLRVGTRERSKT